MPWTRPSSVPYPSVWGHCTGRKPLPDGNLPQFRIQDAPEEMFDEIVDHMASVFLTAEPLAVNSKVPEDPVSVADYRKLWRAGLNDKLCLVAILELPDGTEKLAGVNVTCMSLAENKDKAYKFQSEAMMTVLGLIGHLTKMADVFELYGVDAYMTAYGLSVSPAYQGQGLGLEILKARVPLCKATGIKLTATVFSVATSQELARRAGFETVAEIAYKDYKIDGKEVFAGIPVKMCKKMALKIE